MTIALGRSDGWRATGIYGFAHLGKSLFWYGSELLFAFYLTELVGLPASQMGMVLALGLLVSAGIDLVVGGRFAGRLSDAGRAARLQFVGSICCAAAFTGVFLGFWIPEGARFAYAIGAGLVFRLAYAVYDLPQNALMALATDDAAGRDRVAATRIWFSGAATLLVALSVGPLIAGRGVEGATLYVALALTIAVPAIASAGLLAGALAQSPQDPSPAPTQVPGRPERPPRLFWLLLCLMVVTSLATPAFSKVEPFFAAYALRSPTWGGMIVTAMALGVILGQPVWRILCGRFSRVTTLVAAATLQVVALSAFWLLPMSYPLALAGAAFVFGLGNGGVGMAQWAGFSEVVATAGKGREGLAYAVFTAVSKASLGLGSLGLGLVLSGFDYRDGDNRGLVALMTTIPAVGAVLCLVIAVAWSSADRNSQIKT